MPNVRLFEVGRRLVVGPARVHGEHESPFENAYRRLHLRFVPLQAGLKFELLVAKLVFHLPVQRVVDFLVQQLFQQYPLATVDVGDLVAKPSDGGLKLAVLSLADTLELRAEPLNRRLTKFDIQHNATNRALKLANRHVGLAAPHRLGLLPFGASVIPDLLVRARDVPFPGHAAAALTAKGRAAQNK